MTINRLSKVDYWLDKGYLDIAFSQGMTDNVFEHIYVPITLPDDTGTSTTEWVDVGLAVEGLSYQYGVLNTGNYLMYSPDADGRNKLSDKINVIYNKNKYKYLKLIELMGYKYNPLFNVDGVELYGEFENQGVNDIKSTTKGKVTNTNEAANGDDAPKTTHKVAPFDSASTKIESEDVASGKTTNTTQYGEQPTGGDYQPLTQETTVTHNNAKNIVNNQETDYSVAASDNVFGTALTGADKFHVDKRIRQGNIGVTKTQELIAAERENLKFNLFDVFYKDLSEQILVEVYDY